MAEAEGFWASAAIPGVGIRRVFVPPDELEERAAARGMVRLEVAAEMLGRQPGYVASLARSNVLGVTRWEGRDWIYRSAVDRYLAAVGFPSDEERALEAAEARGDSYTASLIRSRMLAEDQARMAALGWQPTPPAVARSAEDLPDPVAGFISKYLKGGR